MAPAGIASSRPQRLEGRANQQGLPKRWHLGDKLAAIATRLQLNPRLRACVISISKLLASGGAKVPFAVTGTNWNGPRFFGLRAASQAEPS